MADADPESATKREAQETQWRTAEGERLLVVGIGASAGGIEAFERFLARLPPASGLAYVLVQHLDPQHESILADILGRAAGVPVEFAKDGQGIARDHLYIMPPHAGLLVEGGKLRLVAPEPRSSRLPINAFLSSLAEDQGENAVGIILSGTGSDGALGMAAVKKRGGRTFAQLPGDARYESMPQAAIATGMVDQVLPAHEIPAALVNLAAERREHPGESARGEAEGLREVFEILARKTGHDFSRYKRTTVLRRLQRRMAATSTATVRDYVALLDRDDDELRRISDDLMINVTSFFRDDEPFQALERLVIPKLLEQQSSEGVRAWVAGCSSGEEAYTLAMLFREQAERMPRPPHVQIFATDIDASALAEARRGRYSGAVERQVSPGRLARFFVKGGDSYTATKDIRDLCIFTQHDILNDPPFSRINLVSCRNLLIYLEPAMQRHVIELAHYALRPGGYLLLGKAEVIDARELELFEVIEKSNRIFRRREVERRPGLPLLKGRRGEMRTLPLEVAPLARRGGADVRSAADRSRTIVLEEYAPPSVVVDGRGEIRYYWGANLASYLPPQAGAPATNLLHLVRRELKVELSAALHSAARQEQVVTHRDVPVTVGGVERRLNLVVRPLPPTEQDPDDLFLVVFQELQAFPPSQGAPLDEPSLDRYRQIEEELENTRGRLQLTVDELENANEALRASNEELQSMNEELHSSNEELQTSQEELQSVNEELNTVNSELSKKVEELDLLYGDLHNLFQSTQIATVFLDHQLRIARFTPEAVSVFRLADGDVGRPLSDLAAHFDTEGLAPEAERVLRTLEPVERTVRMIEPSRWFLMRIHPYRTPSNVIAGIVIAFIDVTKLKDVEAALQEAVEERERAERAEQALQDANQRKDEFLAVLSHELRNPLTPICNGLHILERVPPGGESAERAKKIIARQVGHLTRLVNDLLEVTRVSRGKLQVQRQRIDLAEVVRRTADDYRPLFTERGVELTVHLPDRPTWVDGDFTRLAQVVGNLLQNAAKFTPGGGSVRVSLEAARDAVLRVRDTGMGIDPLVIPRLFQPFAQAESTLDRSQGGLGLGLALVRGLVELHGGTVEAHSAGKGAGTEFVVKLPLAGPPVAPTVVAGAPPGPRRVLVIEDNADGAESLRIALEMEGHEVEMVHDGQAGLDRVREFAPDVVLCDIGLPGMDGYEVAKAIREAPAGPRPLLVALTGYARAEDQQRAEEAGFDAHLAKPPTIEQVQEVIARAPRRGPEPLP
jgi:two-component system CheB/CheR fusion protein